MIFISILPDQRANNAMGRECVGLDKDWEGGTGKSYYAFQSMHSKRERHVGPIRRRIVGGGVADNNVRCRRRWSDECLLYSVFVVVDDTNHHLSVPKARKDLKKKKKKDPHHLFRFLAYWHRQRYGNTSSSARHAVEKLSHTVTSTYRLLGTAAVVVRCNFSSQRRIKESESRLW